MICTFTGKNIKVTEGMKEAIISKTSKLDKYFDSDVTAKVLCCTDNNKQKIEITIVWNKKVIRSEVLSDDLYSSIDHVIDDLERKIRKYKTKFEKKYRGESIRTMSSVDEKGLDEFKIEKVKKYDSKPMYPEDACLEMEMVGHDFYVFVNAETEQTNVLYKRKNGSYGLISLE